MTVEAISHESQSDAVGMRLDDPEPAADFSLTVTSSRVPHHYLAGTDGAAATSLKAWLDAYLASKPEPYRWLMLEYDLIDIPEERKAAPAINLRSDASLTPGGATLNRLALPTRSVVSLAGVTRDMNTARCPAHLLCCPPAQ